MKPKLHHDVVGFERRVGGQISPPEAFAVLALSAEPVRRALDRLGRARNQAVRKLNLASCRVQIVQARVTTNSM